MDRDATLVQTAIQRGLFTPEEGTAALSEARSGGRPVSEVLVSRGLLAPRTLAALEAPLAPQQPRPLGGDFELTQKLGEGGMGAVYRARQRSLQRDVAVKVLAPTYAANPDAAARFLREAQSAARVSHPNVITVFHVGQDQGRLFMVMELVTGGDADALAKKSGGRLPERRALEVIRDAAAGLVAIERAGLVHRDIKPSNIFITDDGTAKLADLGLARSQAGEDKMTQSGMIVGTPAFMAPEQANALPVDVRTDIYALGATLFQLLTGRAPFIGGTSLAVMTRVLNDPPPDPLHLVPGLTAATRLLVLRAMAKAPEERHPSAQAFLEAVMAALAPRPTATRPAAASGRGVAPTLPPTRPATTRTAAPAPSDDQDDEEEEEEEDEEDAPEQKGPAPALIAGVVGGLVLLLIVFGLVLRRGKRDDAPSGPVAKTTTARTAPPPPPPATETPKPSPPEHLPLTEAPPPEPVLVAATETPPLPAAETPALPATEAPAPVATETPPLPATEAAPPVTTEAPVEPEPEPEPEVTPEPTPAPAPRPRPAPLDARALTQLIKTVLEGRSTPSAAQGGSLSRNGTYTLEAKGPQPARGSLQASADMSAPTSFVWRVDGFTREKPKQPFSGPPPGEPPPPPGRGPRRNQNPQPQPPQNQPPLRVRIEFAARTGSRPAAHSDELGGEAAALVRLEVDEDRTVSVSVAQLNAEKVVGARLDPGPGVDMVVGRRTLSGFVPTDPFMVVLHVDELSWTVALFQNRRLLLKDGQDWDRGAARVQPEPGRLRSWASFELSGFTGVSATPFARTTD